MIEYLKALHPIGTVGLEQRFQCYSDTSCEDYWSAAVHYYGLCSVAQGHSPIEAIHAVIAKRDETLATAVAPTS